MRYNEIKKGNMVDLSGIELPEAYEYLKSATIGVYYPMHEVEFMHLDKTGRGYKGTEIPFSNIYNEEHIKICSCCGDYMAKGYVVNDDYYCSDECFDNVYDSEIRLTLSENDEDIYYTEWEEIEQDDNEVILQSFIAKCDIGDEWETATEKYIRTK